jgi:hypothetical protein
LPLPTPKGDAPLNVPRDIAPCAAHCQTLASEVPVLDLSARLAPPSTHKQIVIIFHQVLQFNLLISTACPDRFLPGPRGFAPANEVFKFPPFWDFQ